MVKRVNHTNMITTTALFFDFAYFHTLPQTSDYADEFISSILRLVNELYTDFNM